MVELRSFNRHYVHMAWKANNIYYPDLYRKSLLTSDLVSHVSQCPFCCILLFSRSKPVRPAYAQGEKNSCTYSKPTRGGTSHLAQERARRGVCLLSKCSGCWADPNTEPLLGETVCFQFSRQVNCVEKVPMVHSFSTLVNTIAHTRVVRAELVPPPNYTSCSGALMLKSFWPLLQCSNWTAWIQKNCFLLKENSWENYKNGMSEKMQHFLGLLKCQTSGHRFIWLILQGYKQSTTLIGTFFTIKIHF